jgi:hypothetical protein
LSAGALDPAVASPGIGVELPAGELALELEPAAAGAATGGSDFLTAFFGIDIRPLPGTRPNATAAA